MTIGRNIPSATGLSPAEFRDRYLLPGRPVLLDGFARDWPAFGKWSPEHFAARFGDVLVEVATDLGALWLVAPRPRADAEHFPVDRLSRRQPQRSGHGLTRS